MMAKSISRRGASSMPNRVENAREENVSFLMEMEEKLWPGV
jgi:hypothetical protein